MHGWTNRAQSDAATRTPSEMERMFGSLMPPFAAGLLAVAWEALLAPKRPRNEQPILVRIDPIFPSIEAFREAYRPAVDPTPEQVIWRPDDIADFTPVTDHSPEQIARIFDDSEPGWWGWVDPATGEHHGLSPHEP